MDTRQAIAKLELVGIHGKKAQSTLTEGELALVRKGEAPQAATTLVLGEDKVVAERVVTKVDQNEHLVTAREEVHENRIRPDVIRRRTKRVEVHEEAAPPPSPEIVFTAPSLLEENEPFVAPPPIAFGSPEPVPSVLLPQPTTLPTLPQETSELVAPAEESPPDVSLEPALETQTLPTKESTEEESVLSTDSLVPPEKETPAALVDISADETTESATPATESIQSVPARETATLAQPESIIPQQSKTPPMEQRKLEPSETTPLNTAPVSSVESSAPVAPTQAKTQAPVISNSPSSSPSSLDAEIRPRPARVLGRIDLTKLQEAKPVRPEPRPKVSAPSAEPGASAFREPTQNGGATPSGVLPKRGKKRKVIRKPAQLETQERDTRLGRGKAQKRRIQPGKEQRQTEITIPKASKRIIRVSEVISVGELAKQLGVKAGEVIKKLMGLGLMATINQVLDIETATLVANEFEYTIDNVAFDVDSVLEDSHEPLEDEGKLEPRPPVVTIMGHVDHGKTSLLDAIRETNVTAHEHGGITQHIGAYSVELEGRRVTFLDTPGHAAFTAMRARGAEVTDIVVLVVAADDGVMPQTIEAINHARAAKVPIIVAVNKMDKPGADIERVKRDLMNYGLLSEELGGDTIFAPVSALTGEGIPQLLEMILLQADIMELRSHPDKLSRGIIVEAKLDRGRGPVATLLVQEGELKVGNPFVCGIQHGRVRAMLDSWGNKVETASSSMPVEILGLAGVPEAGDSFVVLNDEAKARQVAEHRRSKRRETELAKNTKRASLEDFHQQIQAGEVKDIRVIIKGDVQGSVEAISDALNHLSTDEVKVTILHASPGGISESDVLLATASKGIILGFNIRPEGKAAHLAEQDNVEIRLYNVIYELIEDIRAALEGLLEPVFNEKPLGQAEVREVFSISRLGLVAGCFINEGRILKGAQARLLRDKEVIYEGKIATLRRFKDDVREVPAGSECGVGFENCKDIKPGDTINIYEVEKVLRRLEPRPQHELEQRV